MRLFHTPLLAIILLSLSKLTVCSSSAVPDIGKKLMNGFRRFAGTYSEPESYSPLIMFTTDAGVSGYCDRMEQLLGQLESHLKVKIERINIWRSPLNFKLFEKFDGGNCNGLPLLVNRSTGAKICGSSTKRNLLNWATGRDQTKFMGDWYGMPNEEQESDDNSSF